MENSNYYELRLDFTDFRMKDSSCLKNDGSVHEKLIYCLERQRFVSEKRQFIK